MSTALWSKVEQSAWRLPREISVSEWTDENRVLDPMTSAEPGQWTTARTPYLREPMDSIKDAAVEEIILMMSTQVGKTECMLNMLAYHIDQDPAPALWVMPRETDAKDVCDDRIKPMVRLSAALAGHLTGYDDDLRKLKLVLDRMILYLQGANSPAGLASKPIRILFMDEVDKFPSWAGKEADPIKLAEERTRTFWNRKKVKCSTPTTRDGYIFREYQRTDKRRFYVPCPHCRKFQVLVFSQIRWPEEERDSRIIRDRKLAFYECMECAGKITDIHKPKMLIRGVWVPDGCSVGEDGKVEGEAPETASRGYWINALYSPWLTFSEIASEFLISKDSPETLMNFVNSWLAEVWEEKLEETRENEVYRLAAEYQQGTVPAGVVVLTAAVDVQKDHFYLIVRGWGYGEESWLVRASRVESWTEVEAALFLTDYVKPSGEKLRVRIACVDSGFRTDEVYGFCRKWKNLARAVKGMERETGVPYTVSKIEKHAKTGKPIEGGIALWRIDTVFYKNKISRMVSSESGDPSQWHVFRNPPRAYVSQFCSEHKVIERDRRRGSARVVWKKKGSQTPNHFWDCEVYSAAAADMIYVSSLRRPAETSTFKPADEDTPKNKWLQRNRGTWIRRG